MNAPSAGFSPLENPHCHDPAGKRGGSNIGFSGTQHGRPAPPWHVAAVKKPKLQWAFPADAARAASAEIRPARAPRQKPPKAG